MQKIAWWTVMFLISLSVFEGGTARGAHAHPLSEATALRRAACQLHSELGAHGVDPATDRYICRLETAIAELVEKLECPHDVGAIECALRETSLWLERTTIGIRSNCRLHECSAVMLSLESSHVEFAHTLEAIECWLAQGRRASGRTLGQLPPAPSPYSFGAIGGHRDFRPGDARIGNGYATGSPSTPAPPPGWAGPQANPFAPPLPSRSSGTGGEFGRLVLRALLSELAR